MLGRVRSLLRVKRYHDTVVTQAAELAQWNRQLEARVAQRVERLDRYGRLRRFFSPQITRLLLDQGDDTFLTSHRREITAVFCDLRGFTGFAETSDPEEVMSVPPHTTEPWVTSSSSMRARSSTSPATGCSSSSTTRSRFPTRRPVR